MPTEEEVLGMVGEPPSGGRNDGFITDFLIG